MSVEAVFYNFAKRINSLKIPGGGRSVGCNLRDGSDKFSPNLEIRSFNPTGYNYMYIPLFSRYYYINKCLWNAEEHYWVVSGEVDALASHRSAIMASTQMVVRSSVDDLEDIRLADSLFCPFNEPSSNIKVFDMSSDRFENDDTRLVICNIAGQGLAGFSLRDYNQLQNNLFENHSPLVTEFWTEDLAKQLMNPASYFIGQLLFPLRIPTVWIPRHPRVAWWVMDDVTCYIPSSTYTSLNVSVQVPIHPDAQGEIDHYLNSPPYINRHLYIGGFGQIPLNDQAIHALDILRIDVTVDYFSGGAKLVVRNITNGYAIVGYAVAQMGSEISLSTRNPLSLSSMISTVAGAAVGGVTGVVGGVAQGLDMITSMNTALTQGSTGGTSNWNDMNTSMLISNYRRGRFPSRFRQGRPVYREVNLSGLSGLVVCANPTCQIDGSKEEIEEIYNRMSTGVYLE